MTEPITAATPSAPTASELYAVIRGQIEHEDNLIAQRLSWLMAAQSFLFTAYAITLNAAPQPSERAAALQKLLQWLVPAVAAAVSLLTLVTVVAGVAAMNLLRAWFLDRAGPAPLQHLPPIQGVRRTVLLGTAGPVLLPVLFAGVWAYLLVRATA